MRSTFLLSSAISVVFSLGLAVGASAAPIFTNGETDPSAFGTPSDVDFNQEWAHSFSLTGGDTTVRSISWDGFYAPDGILDGAENFTIKFYSDLGQAADYVITLGAQVEREDTGLSSLFGTSIYSYSANVGELSFQEGVYYYLSIVADTTGDANSDWAWAGTSDFSIGAFGKRGDGPFRPNFTYGSVFTLDNASLPSATVPEPSAFFLMLAGLFGLSSLRRAKR